MYVDVHCHLDHDELFNDIDNVIDRAEKAGVKRIIAAGVNSGTNRKILEK